MSIEEAYMIDRINRIYTGVDAPIWISCENFDRIPHVKGRGGYGSTTYIWGTWRS